MDHPWPVLVPRPLVYFVPVSAWTLTRVLTLSSVPGLPASPAVLLLHPLPLSELEDIVQVLYNLGLVLLFELVHRVVAVVVVMMPAKIEVARAEHQHLVLTA